MLHCSLTGGSQAARMDLSLDIFAQKLRYIKFLLNFSHVAVTSHMLKQLKTDIFI